MLEYFIHVRFEESLKIATFHPALHLLGRFRRGPSGHLLPNTRAPRVSLAKALRRQIFWNCRSLATSNLVWFRNHDTITRGLEIMIKV